MIHLINYADQNFKWPQRLAAHLAKYFSGVNLISSFGPEDIDLEFKTHNDAVLKMSRGGGYWLWKPYFLRKCLDELNEGDWLIYLDSGIIVYKNIKKLIGVLEKENQDVFGFELPLLEKQWTKRLVYERFGLEPDNDESNQIMATAIILRKSAKSLEFVREYLNCCLEFNLLNDVLFSDQSSDFIEHRHDQSIFSLLYKSYGFKACQDFSQRDKQSKTYVLCDYNTIKEKDILYRLSDGRFFRKNTKNLIATTPYVFIHKSREPLVYMFKYGFKFLIGFNRRRYL